MGDMHEDRELESVLHIAGQVFAVKYPEKGQMFYDLDPKLADDSYFKMLKADGKLKTFDELEATVELTPEQLAEKEAAEKAQDLADAKAELEVLSEKEQLTKKEKSRKAELEALVGA